MGLPATIASPPPAVGCTVRLPVEQGLCCQCFCNHFALLFIESNSIDQWASAWLCLQGFLFFLSVEHPSFSMTCIYCSDHLTTTLYDILLLTLLSTPVLLLGWDLNRLESMNVSPNCNKL